MTGWPYIAPLETETISRMVRARREWWAKRKQLSRAGNGQHCDMRSDSRDVGKERQAGIKSSNPNHK